MTRGFPEHQLQQQQQKNQHQNQQPTTNNNSNNSNKNRTTQSTHIARNNKSKQTYSDQKQKTRDTKPNPQQIIQIANKPISNKKLSTTITHQQPTTTNNTIHKQISSDASAISNGGSSGAPASLLCVSIHKTLDMVVERC